MSSNAINLFGSTCVIVMLLTFFYYTIIKTKRRYFNKYGIPGTAKISRINKTNIEYGNGVYARPLIELVLNIEHDPLLKEIMIKQAFHTWEMPKVGDDVNILIGPRDSKNVLIVIS